MERGPARQMGMIAPCRKSSAYLYASAERKLIKHIVRVTGMEHSVFFEMEHGMKTVAAKLFDFSTS